MKMDKKKPPQASIARQLLNVWQQQDRSFRIAIWVGLSVIFSIICLKNLFTPLNLNPEYVDSTVDHEIYTTAEQSEDYTKQILSGLENVQPVMEIPEQIKNHELAVKVKRGDTLSDIFTRYNINVNDLYSLLHIQTAKKSLTRLNPGQEIYMELDAGNNLLKLSMQIDASKTLRVTRPAPQFKVQIEEQAAITKLSRVSGTIESSLYDATEKANIPRKIALEFAKIFSGKINFGRDLHPGDSFKVIYQRKVINGKTVSIDHIVAAEVNTKKHHYQALRYKTGNATRYYTPEGKSLDPAFSRAPVKYYRISSQFDPQRIHPILKIKRPHYGVDFAAPRGTPVHTVSDGKVIFADKDGGYGNVVVINHGNRVQTRYAHLKKFANNIQKGSKVTKEQVIGYVGSTGLATGPHLHYEYRIHGKAYDPLKVMLPESYTIPETQLAQFKIVTAPLLAELNSNTTQFAKAETGLAEG